MALIVMPVAESEVFDTDQEIAFPDENGLVRREGVRMLSLVMLGANDG